MTTKQVDLYVKLRNKLKKRGISNLPTALKVHEFNNQKTFMLLKSLNKQIGFIYSWESSPIFREICYNKYGPDFSPYKHAEKEINEVLEYAK